MLSKLKIQFNYLQCAAPDFFASEKVRDSTAMHVERPLKCLLAIENALYPQGEIFIISNIMFYRQNMLSIDYMVVAILPLSHVTPWTNPVSRSDVTPVLSV